MQHQSNLCVFHFPTKQVKVVNLEIVDLQEWQKKQPQQMYPILRY